MIVEMSSVYPLPDVSAEKFGAISPRLDVAMECFFSETICSEPVRTFLKPFHRRFEKKWLILRLFAIFETLMPGQKDK
jgi:hypothetical protein